MSDESQNGSAAQGSESALSSTGADVFTDSGAGGGEGSGTGQSTATPNDKGGASSTATPPSPLSADALAAAVDKIVSSREGRQSQQREEPQLTTEQFEKAFHVFKPTPELLTALGINPTEAAMKGFGDFSHALVKQVLVMTSYLMEQKYGEVMKHVTPLQQHYQTTQDAALESRFFEQFPDMKDKRPLLVAIKSQLVQEKFRGTEAEAFAEVHKRATQILGGGAASAGGSQQANGNGSRGAGGAPRMSGVSTPGQGGAGGGGKAPKSAGQSVWS